MDTRGTRLMLLAVVLGVLLCQAHGLVGRRESLKTGEAELTRVKRGDSYGEQELVRIRRASDEDRELTRVKRGREEPALTRVKRMEDDEPSLMRVKRPDNEPGLKRVKRMDDEVELVRTKRIPADVELVRVKRMDGERELQRAKRPDEDPELSRTKRVRRDAGVQQDTAHASPSDQGKQLSAKEDNSKPAEKAVPAQMTVQVEGETGQASGPARGAPYSHVDKIASGPTERKEIPSPRLPPIRSPGHWDTLEPARDGLDAQAEKPRADAPKSEHAGARAESKAREEERELEDHAAQQRRTHPRAGQRHHAAERLAAKRHWLETHHGQRRRGEDAAARAGKHHQQAAKHGREGKWRETLSRRIEEEVKRGMMLQHEDKEQRLTPAGRASKRGHGKVWQRLRAKAHRRQNRLYEKRNQAARARSQAARARSQAARAKPVKAAPAAKAVPVQAEAKPAA